jgi:hypothetical protein
MTEVLDTGFAARPALWQENHLIQFRFLDSLQRRSDVTGVDGVKNTWENTNPPHPVIPSQHLVGM